MKYVLLAYFLFTNPTTHWGQPELIDTFEGESAYQQCIHFQGLNRWENRKDGSLYIVCIQSADI